MVGVQIGYNKFSNRYHYRGYWGRLEKMSDDELKEEYLLIHNSQTELKMKQRISFIAFLQYKNKIDILNQNIYI